MKHILSQIHDIVCKWIQLIHLCKKSLALEQKPLQNDKQPTFLVSRYVIISTFKIINPTYTCSIYTLFPSLPFLFSTDIISRSAGQDYCGFSEMPCLAQDSHPPLFSLSLANILNPSSWRGPGLLQSLISCIFSSSHDTTC